MLRKYFYILCKIFNKKEPELWIEPAAIITTVMCIILSHTLLLFVVFEFELVHLVELYGNYLLVTSVITFVGVYYLLCKKFKIYSKR